MTDISFRENNSDRLKSVKYTKRVIDKISYISLIRFEEKSKHWHTRRAGADK